METLKVIVKMEKHPEGLQPLLCFPEASTNPGNIEVWAWRDGHNEASIGYFWSLRKPKPEHEAAALTQIKNYEQQYKVTLLRVLRDNQKMRCERWKR